MPWMLFLLSAVVIVLAGTKLARYADQIAELSGLGRVWIGVVLVAGAPRRRRHFTAGFSMSVRTWRELKPGLYSASGKGGRVPIHVSVVHVMPFIKYPELKEAGRHLVERSVRKLVKAGFTAEAVYQLGKPAEEIMKVASKHHADLIVMGPRAWAPSPAFSWGAFRREWSSTVLALCWSCDDNAKRHRRISQGCSCNGG